MISKKNYIQKVDQRASTSQWTLGRFDISQNEFEMRLAKNRIKKGPLIIRVNIAN